MLEHFRTYHPEIHCDPQLLYGTKQEFNDLSYLTQIQFDPQIQYNAELEVKEFNEIGL